MHHNPKYKKNTVPRLPISSWRFQKLISDKIKLGNLYKQVNNLITDNHFDSIYENNADLIMDYLWLGNSKSAHDVKFVLSNKIRCIINVTKNIQNKFSHIKLITYVRLPIDDKEACQKNLFTIMEKGADYLNNVVSLQYPILVHCKRGHHRSASIVALYLMKYYRISLLDAIHFIKRFRPSTFRRMTCMLRALIHYEYARTT